MWMPEPDVDVEKLSALLWLECGNVYVIVCSAEHR